MLTNSFRVADYVISRACYRRFAESPSDLEELGKLIRDKAAGQDPTPIQTRLKHVVHLGCIVIDLIRLHAW
jgi:hypothetical protein